MATEKLMKQAHTFATTEDLLEYLEAVSDRSIQNLRINALASFLLPYLLHLPDDRFSVYAWSRALSVFFVKHLRFKSVRDAKLWLCACALDRL